MTLVVPAGDDPVHAPARLHAVAATELLDTPPESAFDDLTRLAAVLIGAPFAFATIVDDRRSFWKSTFGVPAGAPRENTIEESFCQYVVRSGSELFVGDAANDALTCANPSIEAMGVCAWAGFPIVAPDGEVLGSFCVVDTVPRDWTPREAEVLRTLAGAASREIALRAALASERRARLRAEALTHTLQATLLPPELPVVPGLDVAVAFHPAGTGTELGGDFYDLFETGRGSWSFVVGDVCGKGIDAAKTAALARHTVGVAALRSDDPALVMQILNETIRARRETADLFLTAVYGTFRTNGAGCEIRLVIAGHLPPLVRRADGTTATVDVRGTLIGTIVTLDIEETTIQLEPGDSLIIFTDGVTEARRDNAFFGEDAVQALVAGLSPAASAASLARTIECAALAFANGVASDDIAVLALRVPAA